MLNIGGVLLFSFIGNIVSLFHKRKENNEQRENIIYKTLKPSSIEK